MAVGSNIEPPSKPGANRMRALMISTAIAVIPGFMKLLVSLFRDRVGRAGDFCGRPFCGALFHHDRHLHAAVAKSAVVIADRLERPRRRRRHRHLGHLPGLDVGVDFQCADHESVRPVGAGQLQRNRLTLHQGDVIGREAELAGRDLDDLCTFAGTRAGRCCVHGQSRN
jgi:hypothetical protein